MKKTYKIDVDCANCANLMEDATRKRTERYGELYDPQDERGVRGRSGPQDCYAGGSQGLQEGGTRLRDLPVSQQNEMPC